MIWNLVSYNDLCTYCPFLVSLLAFSPSVHPGYGNFGGRSNFPYTNSTTNGIYEMNIGRVEDMRGDN